MNAIQQTIPHRITASQSRPLRILAEAVSYIFHPVFFPLVMSVAITFLAPSFFVGVADKQVKLWLLSIAISAVFFPLFSTLLMKPLGFIGSFKMETARERTIPLMATMIFYFWVSHAFNNMNTNPPLVLKVLLLGNFWGVILMFIANIFTKVSMHTAVAGGMVGIIIVLMILSPANLAIPLIVSIILAGIMGTARMILGAHQRGDIWLGYIIGVFVQLGAYLYMK